jgi:hypothetical protein
MAGLLSEVGGAGSMAGLHIRDWRGSVSYCVMFCRRAILLFGSEFDVSVPARRHFETPVC